MNVPEALVGAHVSRITLDERVRLALTGHAARGRTRLEAELSIAAGFEVGDPVDGFRRLAPGSRVLLTPVLDLFAKTVSRVTIDGRGALDVRFDDGTCLAVAPHPSVESWRLTGTGFGPVSART
ncbi:DUF6188 family protein [Streptomyces avicenniae]|uniref:DUF6188 family protein n=1 Tax=Streptomyces avicenniae TaxID=500153 RepID=UPI00069C04CA|nr:DUF6188 family protein [Streptomyces avicenniae]